MKKLVFSPAYRDKIHTIRLHITSEYGQDVCKKVMKKIKSDLSILKSYEEAGVSVKDRFGLDTEYRYLYTCHCYIFYLVDSDAVRIIQIYHEREDFMWKLFGVRTSSEESEKFWED